MERDLQDPLFKLLNKRGYLPILMPRSGVWPPTVYSLEGDQLVLKAPLKDYFNEGSDALAKLRSTPAAAPDLAKVIGAQRAGKATLNLLDQILQFFNLSGGVQAKLSGRQDEGLDVSFTDVRVRTVPPDVILRVIQDLPSETFNKEEVGLGKVHIAYEYLYAHKLSVFAGGRAEVHADVGVGVDKAAGISGGYGSASKDKESMTAGGTEPLAIALKVGALQRTADGFRLICVVRGEAYGMLPDQGEPDYYLPKASTGRAFNLYREDA